MKTPVLFSLLQDLGTSENRACDLKIPSPWALSYHLDSERVYFYSYFRVLCIFEHILPCLERHPEKMKEDSSY